MLFSSLRSFLPRLAALVLCAAALAGVGVARQQQKPMTNAEFLAFVRQLPEHPGMKDQLIAEIRRRGISFTLTSGLRAFVATKSGNDAELKHVLEEAERRFLNPSEAKPLPPVAETEALLAKTRAATLEAASQMPDFVVKQLITRSKSLDKSQNWKVADRLVVGVSYRESSGETYRVLAVNGIATPGGTERHDYEQMGGSTSSGEFVTFLLKLFDEKSRTEFKPFDTDTLRGRRVVVYTFDIKQENSDWEIGNGGVGVLAAYRGKVWIDRERARLLHIEAEFYDFPATYPVKTASGVLDYDWVNIPGQGDYLLPTRSLWQMTINERGQNLYLRHDIRFRNYQKFGTELKILDDDIIDEEVPAENPAPKPPAKKP
jgi:hypothetical protein